MCRLFGQLSLSPRSAVDFLADSDFSLIAQSKAKRSNLQKDGWGVAWYDAKGKPVVRKSAEPIYKEPAKLRAAAEEAVSTIVVAHVRAASNPLKLPKDRLINERNNQPYADGEWLFAHNGTLNIPVETREALGAWQKRLKGENDSEIWFMHFRKHVEKAGSFHAGVQSALLELWDLWKSCKGEHKGCQAPYTSLNFIASDGRALYALCHSAYRGMSVCGACSPQQPWQLMSWTERDGRLVAASEGFDRGPWTMFAPPETMTARVAKGRIVVERAPLSGVPQTPLALKEAVS